MYVTVTEFRQNIGRYLEACGREPVYIMKRGEVFAKLDGTMHAVEESLSKITGSLNFEHGTYGESEEVRM